MRLMDNGSEFYVSRVAVGYTFGYEYYRQRNLPLYTHKKTGWRPTKLWAARVCARRVKRYSDNFEFSKPDGERNPFEILAKAEEQALVASTEAGLTRLAKDLRANGETALWGESDGG